MFRKIELVTSLSKKGTALEVLGKNEFVEGLSCVLCAEKDKVAIAFVCAAKNLSEILLSLESIGIGSEDGFIHILTLEAAIPPLVKIKGLGRKRKYKVAVRRTVREIEATIDGNLHLTFDYIMFVIVASMIACVGLLTDSAVVVVASMLVSPLMGPILAIAFGLSIRRKDFILLGLRNECYGILIAICCGALSGLVAVLFYQPIGVDALMQLTGNKVLSSEEMESRGKLISLFTGFFLAMPSGIGVCLATVNASLSALVGVAISAALLPPTVNFAINLTFGTVHYIVDENSLQANRHLDIAFYSFLLFLLNFITIILSAVGTFRLKGITWRTLEFSGTHSKKNEELSVSVAVPGSLHWAKESEDALSPLEA